MLFSVLCCDWASQISLPPGAGVASSDPPGWHTLVLWSMHGRSEAILVYLICLLGSSVGQHCLRALHRGRDMKAPYSS